MPCMGTFGLRTSGAGDISSVLRVLQQLPMPVTWWPTATWSHLSPLHGPPGSSSGPLSNMCPDSVLGYPLRDACPGAALTGLAYIPTVLSAGWNT